MSHNQFIGAVRVGTFFAQEPLRRLLMLELARNGELSGVAVAGVDMEGYTHTAFEGGENIATLIGATERLKYRLLQYQAGE